MKKNKILFYLFFLLATSLYASSYDGISSLIETPTAKIKDDFTASLFYARSTNEDQNYGVSFSPLANIQVDFFQKQLKNSVKNNKDKIINLKLLLYPESEIVPAIAYGMDDILGNGNYSSKYLVLSKKISYFDFTLGYAVGRLGASDSFKNNTKSSFDYLKNSSFLDGSVFGGVEFLFKKDLSFLLEYSPIDYRLDKKTSYRKEVKSNINFGIDYKINDKFSTRVSFNRGERLAFALSYNFDFSKKPRKVRKRNNSIKNNLFKQDYKNINIEKSKDSVYVKYDSKKYYYDMEDYANISNTILDDKNQNYDYIYLSNNDNGKVFKVNTQELIEYKKEKVSNTYMKDAIKIYANENEFKEKESFKTLSKKSLNKSLFDYDISLKSNNYLSETKHPIVNKTIVDLNGKINLFKDASISTTVSIPVINSMDKLKESSSYDKHNKPYVDNLFASYSKNLKNNDIINVDAGILEQKYTGINLEYQKEFFNEKLAFSLQYQNLFKRDSSDIFKLEDKNLDAKFLNVYYQSSEDKNTHLGVRIGEFLNDDKGFRIDFSRSFNSFILGAYYARSDMDNMANEKGFYIKIPLSKRYFNNAKSRINLNFSSVDRDNLEFVDFKNSLFNKYSTENNLQIFKKQVIYLKE